MSLLDLSIGHSPGVIHGALKAVQQAEVGALSALDVVYERGGGTVNFE